MGANFVPLLCCATQKMITKICVLVYGHNLTISKLTELYWLSFVVF